MVYKTKKSEKGNLEKIAEVDPNYAKCARMMATYFSEYFKDQGEVILRSKFEPSRDARPIDGYDFDARIGWSLILRDKEDKSKTLLEAIGGGFGRIDGMVCHNPELSNVLSYCLQKAYGFKQTANKPDPSNPKTSWR